MKAPDQDAFAENVAVDRFENLRPRRVGAEIEFRVEREQLERVVMMRARGGSSRTAIADHAALVLQLNRAVRQLGVGGHILRQLARRPGDIDHHPVKDVVDLRAAGQYPGSCMWSTKLTVLSGTLVHCNRGEIGFGSDCVNLAGISAPSANAVVVRVRPGRAGAFLAASCARAATCDQHGER